MLQLNHTAPEEVELDQDGWPLNRFKPLYFNNPRTDNFNPKLPVGYIYGDPIYYRPMFEGYQPTVIPGYTDDGIPIKYHNDYCINFIEYIPIAFDQLAMMVPPKQYDANGCEIEVDATFDDPRKDIDDQYGLPPRNMTMIPPVDQNGNIPFANAINRLAQSMAAGEYIDPNDEDIVLGDEEDDQYLKDLYNKKVKEISEKTALAQQLAETNPNSPEAQAAIEAAQAGLIEIKRFLQDNPDIAVGLVGPEELFGAPSSMRVVNPNIQAQAETRNQSPMVSQIPQPQRQVYSYQQPMYGYGYGYPMQPMASYSNPFPGWGNPVQPRVMVNVGSYYNPQQQQMYGYGYNNYSRYAPFRSLQQQEQLMQAQIELQKTKYRICCSVTGTEYSEEVAETLFNPKPPVDERTPLQIERDRIWEDTKRIVWYANHQEGLYSQDMLEANFLQEQLKNYHEALDNHSLCEFLEEDLPRLNREIWISKYINKNASKDLYKTYDSKAYNQLLMMHSSSNPYLNELMNSSKYDNNTGESMGLIDLLQMRKQQQNGEYVGLPKYMSHPVIQEHKRRFTEDILAQIYEKAARKGGTITDPRAVKFIQEHDPTAKIENCGGLLTVKLKDYQESLSNGQLNE